MFCAHDSKLDYPRSQDRLHRRRACRRPVGLRVHELGFPLPGLKDVFHADRWDYPFYNKPCYGDVELRSFTVWFKNDLLDHWEGDEQPDRQPFQKADSGKEAIQGEENTEVADKPAEAADSTANEPATPTNMGEDTPTAPGKEE